MFGLYVNMLEKEGAQPLQAPLSPGCPVVAIKDIKKLLSLGLPSELRFGIAGSENSVIWRCCEREDIDNPCFRVVESSLDSFAEGGLGLYSADVYGVERKAMLACARERLGETCSSLQSYPGDDFVAECFSASSSGKLVKMEPHIGQHWSRKFPITAEEAVRRIPRSRSLAGLLPKKIAQSGIDQTHHGIRIEGGRVIHFSSARLGNEYPLPLLKTDTMEGFFSGHEGYAVKYREENEGILQKSRNRAMWVFCHAEPWGEYSLFGNNCEHFSRFCRAGKKESRQVIGAMGVLSAILMRSARVRWLCALGSLLQMGAEEYGTPHPVEKDASFEFRSKNSPFEKPFII